MRVAQGSVADPAVSATALAGCGRGRDGRVSWGVMRDRRGRVTGESPRCAGCPTDPSRKAHGVTETSGSPRFGACCTTPHLPLGELTTPWCGQLTQRVPRPLGTVTEGHGNRPKAHRSVEFRASSSTDLANV